MEQTTSAREGEDVLTCQVNNILNTTYRKMCWKSVNDDNSHAPEPVPLQQPAQTVQPAPQAPPTPPPPTAPVAAATAATTNTDKAMATPAIGTATTTDMSTAMPTTEITPTPKEQQYQHQQQPQPSKAEHPETSSILATTTGFLTALRTKSRPAFDKYCIRAGGMSLWPPPPTIPRFCTIGSFIEQIVKLTDDIDECIWDPEVNVAEGGELASVWAPFRAKINGVVHHVGVEVFVLHKVEGVWKVTGLADSCRFPSEEERVSLA